MSVPLFRFRLTHQLPEGEIDFTNSDFDVSIFGWDQYVFTGSQSFNWTGGKARADGSVSNLPDTAAIGQIGAPFTGNRWNPGKYTISITARNNSAGGSSPLQSILRVFASNQISSIDESISYTGTGTWDVVALGDAYTTRIINFELEDFWNYIFFSFNKVGPTSGYEVDFNIERINIISAPRSQFISEPDGWKDATLKLERHPEFHSLVEYFEGDFIFYGSDGVIDGGMTFIKAAESMYGINTDIKIIIDVSFNSGSTYDRVFNGKLAISLKKEVQDNKMNVPIIRGDVWTEFISRLTTPVNIAATTSINGVEVPVVDLIDINRTSQKVRQKYLAYNGNTDTFLEDTITYVIPDNEYGQIDFDRETLAEISYKYNLPRIENTTRPANLFELEYAGTYSFDILVVTSTAVLLGSSTDANLEVRLQINDDSAITLTKTNVGINGINGATQHTYNATLSLNKADFIRLYFYNNNASGISYTFVFTVGSYMSIVADTVYPSSTSQEYFVHDAGAAIIDRILNKRSTFISEYFGGTNTNASQYDSNGCGYPFSLTTGSQIRGYTFTEKPFFMSFKKWWDCVNPIFGLGLGYITTDEGEFAIEVEKLREFYDPTQISAYISNAVLKSEYDNDVVFKKVTTGFKIWKSEEISALDDPQSVHVYAIPFGDAGKELELTSDAIAASLAHEFTRRESTKKSKDYKFDNDVFITALNTDDVSPDRYQPELSENFLSVTNLNNSDTRYNLVLTPLRNFLRNADYIGGCVQKNISRLPYKFVSGEGNFDLITDYFCSVGQQCIAVICDPLSEKQDINLTTLDLSGTTNYNSTIGYLHLPDLYKTEIDLSWEDYQAILNNRKYAIAVSQTDSNHKKYFIKNIDYKICFGKAMIEMWAYDDVQLTVPESVQSMDPCGLIEPEPPLEIGVCDGDFSSYDSDYAAILEYACSQGYEIPSVEQQALQNQLVLDLKEEDVWYRLDILYIFATDGDRDFAKINWISPGDFSCVEVVAPTFTTNIGFSGNSSTQYMTTGWDPSTDAVHYTQDDAGAFCYINNEQTPGDIVFGSRSGLSPNFRSTHLVPKAAGGSVLHQFSLNNTGGVPIGTNPVSGMGFFHLERSDSANMRLFKDGAQVGADVPSSSVALSDQDWAVLGFNNNGSVVNHSDAQIGMLAAGESLATVTHAGLYNIWNNYFTSL